MEELQLHLHGAHECCCELYIQYNRTCLLYRHIRSIYKFTDYQGVPDYPGQFTSTC